mmetsp:Transcript_29604/g.43288  ORF Transcript_29604/g.43288 Transcript_29604/m.43288 type:complete len:243 (+) Transcript_29604:1-729(+)
MTKNEKKALKKAIRKERKKSMREEMMLKAETVPEEDDVYHMAPPTYKYPGPAHIELAYVEKDCVDWLVLHHNHTHFTNTDEFAIGDEATFKCDLFEPGQRYATKGPDKVGETFWKCNVIAIQTLYINFEEFIEPLWQCFVTDYIGYQEYTKQYDVLGSPNKYTSWIQSSGIHLYLNDPNLRTGAEWDKFHSHQGSFAVIGGIGDAIGINGQLDVVWDDWLMSWYHVYNIESWYLQPQVSHNW